MNLARTLGACLSVLVLASCGERPSGDASNEPREITEGELPANPRTVAPQLDRTVATDFAEATAFLYSGANPIQSASAGSIDPTRAAVIRGRLLRASGEPLPGVTVSVLGHPELGRTASRADGFYDLAANGGGSLTLDYRSAGYLPAQRRVAPARRDYTVLDDVILLTPDSAMTVVDLEAAAAMQVHRAGSVADDDGERTATILFPPQTTATLVMADGTTEPLTRLSVRATEYSVGTRGPAQMPAQLPSTSAYTYAVELTVDEAEAAGASRVDFATPLPFYVENFLDFPVGTRVPTGYYDSQRGAWLPSGDGRVVGVVAVRDGRAELDVTGDGAADTGEPLAQLGIDDAELEQLAQLYAADQTLWRSRVGHFSSWDMNWAAGSPAGSSPPREPDPEPPNQCQGPSQVGSIIECQSQTLGQEIAIAGTPFSLHYNSRRTAGYEAGYRTPRTLEISLSGAELPADVLAIELDIAIAGQRVVQRFPAAPNQRTSFTWDGNDAYGRQLQGAQRVTLRRGYVYPAVYYEPGDYAQNFARTSAVPITGNEARTEVTLWQEWHGTLGGWDSFAERLGGWTLSAHHVYDPQGRTLYRGDGGERSESNTGSTSITTAAGGRQSGSAVDGERALDTRFIQPTALALGDDGSYYVVEALGQRVRRVAADGTVTMVAGDGTPCASPLQPCGDGGPATQAQFRNPRDVAVDTDGTLYVADRDLSRVRRIGSDGVISTFAGTGAFGFSGDDGPAVAAELGTPSGLALANDGSLYVADESNHRVRRIGRDGVITSVAGGGNPQGGANGDGGPAVSARLASPVDVAIAADGSLLILEQTASGRVRRVGADGIITTLAGTTDSRGCVVTTDACGDGGLATLAILGNPGQIAVAPDGAVLIPDNATNRVRVVGSDGIITTLAGSGVIGTRGDGGPALQAELSAPYAALIAADGSLLIADSGNARIRRVASAWPSIAVGDILLADDDGVAAHVFSASGQLRRSVHTLTSASLYEFGYGSSGLLDTVTDGDGNTTTLERDGSGRLTAIVAPFGQRTALEVDASGRLTRISNPLGQTHELAYSAGGLLTGFTTPRGDTTTYSYDDAGRLVRADEPGGGVQTLVRDSATGTELVHTRLAGTGESRVTRYGTTTLADGTIERTHVLPDGVAQRARRSPNGRAEIRENDGSTIAVSASGDPRFGMQAPLYSVDISTGGRTLSRTASHEVELGAAGDPLSVVRHIETESVNGRIETTVYDAAARTFTTTTPLGRVAKRTIDDQGRATAIENPGFDVIEVGYTDFGRVASLAQGPGDAARRSSFAYDDAGLLSRETDALGAVTTYEHDAAARLTRLTLPGDRGVALGYDANGNVTSITPPGRPAHAFTFDSHNRVSGYTPPALPGTGPTTIRYNLAGEILAITESDGSSVEFGYDAGGRRTSTRLAEGVITASYENVTGQITALDAFGRQRLAFQYDGALLRQVTYSGAVAGAVAYTYDDDLSVASISVAGGPLVAIRYDADDQLVAAGDLVLARDPERGTIAATTLGVIADRYTHDGFGDLTEYSARARDAALYEVSYRRDPLGRIASAVETVAGATTNVSYTYDASGRLAAVTRNGTTTESYAYDANGNRIGGTVGAAVSAGSYDAHDRAIEYGAATFTYSANGSLTTRATNGATTRYEHDALGNLRAVALPSGRRVDYVIDGESRRVGKQVDGRLVQGFLYDGDLRIVAELDGAGAVVSRFVYATGANSPAYVVRGGVNYRIIVDHVGSPRLIVDAATGTAVQQLDYDAFGNVVADTNPGFQPFGFAGGLYDRDTGLVHFGAREYEPQTGRWIAKDPKLFGGGDLNLYAYVGNDPINRTDPTGTQAEGGGSASGGESAGGGSGSGKRPSWPQRQIDKAREWFGRKSDMLHECLNRPGARKMACVKLICEIAPTKGGAKGGAPAADAGETVVDRYFDNMNDRDRAVRLDK